MQRPANASDDSDSDSDAEDDDDAVPDDASTSSSSSIPPHKSTAKRKRQQVSDSKHLDFDPTDQWRDFARLQQQQQLQLVEASGSSPRHDAVVQ